MESAAPGLTELPQLSSWLRYGKLFCRQTVSHSLEAIANETQSSVIFTHVDGDRALADAHKQDEAHDARNAMKPLAGMPFAVSDVISVDGQPSKIASNLELADITPAQGPLVRKLRELGAIPVAKTVSTEFSLTVHNLERAQPDNPRYDIPHIAGGNGSAPAVARGLCSFAIGSGAVGLTRVSAALCNVVGFRPGADYWSREGIFPLSRELDAISLVTARTADLVFLMEALGSGTIPDLSGTPLRLGVAKKPFYENLDPVVTQAVTGVLQRLSRKGAVLTPIVIPDYEAIRPFPDIANGTGLVRFMGRDRTDKSFAALDPVTQLALRPGMDADVSDIQILFDNRRALANKVNTNLAHIDALVMPTLSGLAAPISSFTDAQSVMAWQNSMTRNISFANLFNMSAITIPIPAPQPVGLQLVAPAGNEVRLVAVARAVEKALE